MIHNSNVYRTKNNIRCSYNRNIIFKNGENVIENLGALGWVLEIAETIKQYPIYHIILYYNLFNFTNKFYRVRNHSFFETDETGWSKSMLWSEVEEIIYEIQNSDLDPTNCLELTDLII